MICRTIAASICLQMLLGPLARADDPPLAIPVDGVPPPQQQQNLAIPGDAPPSTPPAPARSALTYARGFQDGRDAARHHPVADWAAVGATSGCLFLGIGCVGATAAGGLMTPTPPPTYFQGINNRDPTDNDYWVGYYQGYDRSLRAKRAMAAFAAGSAVTAVMVVVVGGFVAFGASLGQHAIYQDTGPRPY